MSDDLRINFDVDRFNKALVAYAENSKRDITTIMQQQAKLIVRNVIEMTPPGKRGVKGKKARKLGEATVRADINRLFTPVRKQSEVDVGANMKAIHEGARAAGKNGRVPKRVVKTRVKSGEFKEYLKSKLDNVGKLAGGWNPAAQKFGWNPPQWIKRHGASPGSAKVSADDKAIKVKMINKVPYASRIDGLEERLSFAVDMQADNLIKQVNNHLGENSPFK